MCYPFSDFPTQVFLTLFGLPVADRDRFVQWSEAIIENATVGSSEPHQVRIEKTRKALVGGFQAQECVAYVDGQEMGRYSNAA